MCSGVSLWSVVCWGVQVAPTGKVVRAIAILSHPIPNTNNSSSLQIIIPQKTLNRHSDMWAPLHATTLAWPPLAWSSLRPLLGPLLPGARLCKHVHKLAPPPAHVTSCNSNDCCACICSSSKATGCCVLHSRQSCWR